MNLNHRARLFFVLASLLTGLTYMPNSMAAQSSCTIQSVSDLAFTYDPLSTLSPPSVTSTLVISCTVGTTLRSIVLTIGDSTNSTYNKRRMRSASESLSYQLYTDLGHTVIWGDGTNSTSATPPTSSGQTLPYTFPISTTKSFIIYANMLPRQDVSKATYTAQPGPTITVWYQ